jgi:hypothetical protein
MAVLEIAYYRRLVSALIILSANDDQDIAGILFRGIYRIEFKDFIVPLPDVLHRVFCVQLDVCLSEHQDLEEPCL